MSSETTITLNPYRSIRAYKVKDVTQLSKEQLDDFVNLVARAYKKEKPTSDDMKALRKYLQEYPVLCKVAFDLVDSVQSLTIKHMTGDFEAAQMAVEEQLTHIRDELGYNDTPIMEKLLIENIVTAWLHVQYCQSYIAFMMGKDRSINILEFWERRLTLAQRRYLSACETLAKIRKMAIPALQLNIGDKQINVAGNLNPVTKNS